MRGQHYQLLKLKLKKELYNPKFKEVLCISAILKPLEYVYVAATNTQSTPKHELLWRRWSNIIVIKETTLISDKYSYTQKKNSRELDSKLNYSKCFIQRPE